MENPCGYPGEKSITEIPLPTLNLQNPIWGAGTQLKRIGILVTMRLPFYMLSEAQKEVAVHVSVFAMYYPYF